MTQMPPISRARARLARVYGAHSHGLHLHGVSRHFICRLRGVGVTGKLRNFECGTECSFILAGRFVSSVSLTAFSDAYKMQPK